MSRLSNWVLVLVAVGVLAAPALAAEGQAPAAEAAADMAMADAGACIGAAVAALGGGLAVANIGGKAIESIARQPEAAGGMFMPMIITAAMVEGGMLFAILVCLLK
jgi:F-type H+-transporting ATPase subunit c